MKILVLAPPMDSTGGVQRYTATLIRCLKDIKGAPNVRVVSVSAEPQPSSNGRLAFPLAAKLHFFAAAMLQALVWRPQLIICSHVGVARAAWVIRRVFGVPYWIVLHGIEVWGDLPRGKLRGLRDAQRLLTISQFTIETTTARHKLPGANSAMLPPAFAIDWAQTSNATSSEAETDAPVALTVGRLAASEQYKGHDIILDSWTTVRKKIPNAIYWIVGDGDDRPRLEARVQQLGVADSVCFKGALTATDLQDCYDRCRVFAMPARTEIDSQPPRGEGFGIVYLEAMARGKPVLGPHNGAPREFIRSGEHGLLVDPTDSAAVASALVELLGDQDRAYRMGQAARAWVNNEYSEDKFRQRLKAILDEAENKPGTMERNHL